MTLDEVVARELDPMAWDELGRDDDDFAEERRESLRLARIAIDTLRAEGWRSAEEISETVLEESRAAAHDALRQAEERS